MGISYEVIGCPKDQKHDGYEKDASYCPDCEIERLRAELNVLKEMNQKLINTEVKINEDNDRFRSEVERLMDQRDKLNKLYNERNIQIDSITLQNKSLRDEVLLYRIEAPPYIQYIVQGKLQSRVK